MQDEALADLGQVDVGEEQHTLCMFRPEWHQGVVGIVASRLKDRFHRPAVAIAMQPNGIGTGSGRSVAGVDLGHAVRRAVERGILVKGGGHAMAAGLTVEKAKLGELRAFLEVSLRRAVSGSEEGEGLAVDAALSARAASLDLIELLDRAGPFGSGNAEPVFAFPAHQVAYVEANGNGHVRMTLRGSEGTTLKATAFRAADTDLGRALLAARGRAIHVAGTLSVDAWQGRRQPTLRIIDAAEPGREA
jgi:single-stranded-DNA-specific exonuclease